MLSVRGLLYRLYSLLALLLGLCMTPHVVSAEDTTTQSTSMRGVNGAINVRPFPDPDVIDITRPRVLAAQGSGGQCSLG